jgi:uncharacterized membrane protein
MSNLPPPALTDQVSQASIADEQQRPEALFGISFSEPFQAQEFLLAMNRLASQGGLVLRDAVVVVKDEDGRVRVRETTDLQPANAAVRGAMYAGLLGLLIAGPIGWLAGLGLGAGAGALAAKAIDTGIPDEWVEWFKAAVRPQTSTVVALAADVDLATLYHEASRFEGAELVHTTLQPGASVKLAEALRNHSTAER